MQPDHSLMPLFSTHPPHHMDSALGCFVPAAEAVYLSIRRQINSTFSVFVPPSNVVYVNEYPARRGLAVNLRNQYSERMVEVLLEQCSLETKDFNVFGYNSYDKMEKYLEVLATKYPDLIELQLLGESYEGREMKLARISTKPHDNRPIIFIDAGIHAREWAAPAMAMYLTHRLVTDPAAVQEGGPLDGVDWYILPMANPDGYEFSRLSKENRLWRKTRSKNGDCYGVDGNRNYDYKWALSGAASALCHDETYAGHSPFSEPETKMIRNVMLDNADNMKLYISLHTYGQYLVYPWGYTSEYLPPTWQKLDCLAKKVSCAVEQAGGKPFKVMSAGEWYPAAGASDDFAFAVVKIPYSYTMELTDGYEFQFPEQLLRTVLPQFYQGFCTFAANIKDEFGKQRQANQTSVGRETRQTSGGS